MTKYQIVIWENDADEAARILRETLTARLQELGLNADSFVFLDSSSLKTRDPKAPIVGAFLSRSPSPLKRGDIVALLVEGVMVLPVVEELAHYNSYVFEELRGINGMEFKTEDPDMERVAAVLMEGLNLIRKNRRLFVSYRRNETHGTAIQLYEALDRNGFDVFLDTVSIRPGEPFQDVLWHRLADTDVIVLLDSPGFLASRWTTEELAKANSTNIQILQLVWPGNMLTASAAFSRAFPLETTDFEGGIHLGSNARLKESVVQNILNEAESLRARALAARFAYLVEEFCAEARVQGLNPQIQPERFISIRTPSGDFVATVPTIGVPDATRYQEIEDELAKHPSRHSEMMLLYDERGVRQKWLKHLSWLDRNKLPVRSLQVAQCAAWLRGLK